MLLAAEATSVRLAGTEAWRFGCGEGEEVTELADEGREDLIGLTEVAVVAGDVPGWDAA